ncbi:porin [Ideonella sp. B508-1]|uniref:porin n=1 Tax=Ideonella sp. B508-1 TaxID=137716 RepID=UPI000344C52E|nr:porin [Ideonella sp. B508-1]
MKKSLVLTAIAATLAAPAFAQSSVTIYGRLNLSLESVKVDGASKRDNRVVDNSSRIGFSGQEDLGGGNKAIFTLESGFNAATGTVTNVPGAKDSSSRFWGRESTVGLATRYGTLKLGNLGYGNNEAYHATADYVSWINHDTGNTADVLYGGPIYNSVGLQNSVSYNTPDLNGFVGWVQTAEAYDGEKSKPISLAGYYDRGALHLGAGYEKLGDNKSTAVRANYDLGAFGFGGYFDHVTGDKQYNTWRLVGMYTLGANEFHLNYGGTNTVKFADGSSASKAWQTTAGYNYNLSKRTKVYAFVTKVKDDDAAFTGTFNDFGVGIRHNF